MKHKNCCKYFLRQKREVNQEHCKDCTNLKNSILKSFNRESTDHSWNSCKLPNIVLSTKEKLEKLEYLRCSVTALKSIQERQQEIIREQFEVEATVNIDDPVLKLLESLKTHENIEELSKMLIEAEYKKFAGPTAVISNVTAASIQTFASTFSENLKNTAKRLAGKQMQCRYSAETIKFALHLFNISPKSYDNLYQSGVICVPSRKTIERARAANKMNNGSCVSIYKKNLQNLSSNDTNVVLLMDEMRLESGIAWSTTTHSIIGYCEEDISWESLIMDSKSNSNEQDEKIAQYVSQFLVKTCLTGKTFCGEFFFSASPTSTAELKSQIRHVVLSLHVTGFHVRLV